MATSTALQKRPVLTDEPADAKPSWLAVVAEKVQSMRYGVVQVVIHDSRVVQIERTERTRFEVPTEAPR